MGLFGKRQESNGLTTKKEITELVRISMDKAELKYTYDEEKGAFQTGFMGDDLPISVFIYFDDVTINFHCPLNLKATEQNYQNVVWELNAINSELKFGSFNLDAENGYIVFQYGFPYCESKVSPEFFISFLKLLVSTVDAHDGKLKEIAEKVSKDDYWNIYR